MRADPAILCDAILCDADGSFSRGAGIGSRGKAGLGLAQDWPRIGPGLAQDWPSTGPALAQHWPSLALAQNCCSDDGAGSALLEERGAAIGTWLHEAVALQLDGHWLPIPHADGHQVTDHIVVSDGLALVLATRDGHRHMRGDDSQPQGCFLALRTRLPRARLHHEPLLALRQPDGDQGAGYGLAGLLDRAADQFLIVTVDMNQTVDDGLWRIDRPIATRVGIGTLALAELWARQRVLPSKVVPVVDREREGDDVIALGQTSQHRIGVGTGGTALAGEEFYDRL